VSGIAILITLCCRSKGTPQRASQLLELCGRRQLHVRSDVQLHTGKQGQSTPDRAAERSRNAVACRAVRGSVQFASYLVEGTTELLELLYLQQALEMSRAIVLPSADAERRRQQPFLDVVADGTSRHAAQLCELGDPVSREVPGHGGVY
jgi:hypothetical protein